MAEWTSAKMQDETKAPNKQQQSIVNSESATVQQKVQDVPQTTTGQEMPVATKENATTVLAADQGTEPK